MKWIPITEQHLQQLLDWRTSEHVTKYMYTDIEYNLEQQYQWLERIKADKGGKYFIMEYRNEYIGFISLTDIHLTHKRATWNFYVGNMKYAMLAGFLGVYMYNYAFYELGLEKLNGEVMDINEGVRKLHVKQGAREVGVLERHIVKHGIWHDVYMFEMTKDRWAVVGQKFQKYVAEVKQ